MLLPANLGVQVTTALGKIQSRLCKGSDKSDFRKVSAVPGSRDSMGLNIGHDR
jgi:hypothetical protein